MSEPPLVMPPRQPDHIAGASVIVSACSFIVALTASTVLLGWFLDISALRSIVPGFSEMKANSALCLLALAAAFVLDQFRKVSPVFLYVSRVLAVLTLAVGVITLLEYYTPFSFGIDELLFRDVPGAIGTTSPGRMAPQSAFNMVLKGLGILLLDVEWRLWPFSQRFKVKWRPAQILSLLTVIFPIQILTAYAYGVRTVLTLSGPKSLAVQMSIPLAVAFLVLSVATLFSRPDRGIMKIVTARTPASAFLRRLLPGSLILPVLLGWMVIFLFGGTGQPQGYNAATLAVLITIVFTVSIYDSAVRLGRAEEALASANIRLAEAHEAALQASAAKSTFLATMSHELRTPLTAIIGYAELMQDIANEEGLDPRQVTADLGRIRTSGGHLLELVNNVLDLSKIEAGSLELVSEPVNLRQILEHVAEVLQSQVSDNRNVLKIECGEEVLPLVGGSLRLKQILLNLGSNAAKFTQNGEITMTCRCDVLPDDLATRGHVEIRISDTGIGVSEEFLPRMFDHFSQQDPTSTRRYGGTGLGLAITKRLVDLMGGSISVSSKMGLGTTFIVSIPVAPAQRDSPPVA